MGCTTKTNLNCSFLSFQWYYQILDWLLFSNLNYSVILSAQRGFKIIWAGIMPKAASGFLKDRGNFESNIWQICWTEKGQHNTLNLCRYQWELLAVVAELLRLSVSFGILCPRSCSTPEMMIPAVLRKSSAWGEKRWISCWWWFLSCFL